MQVLSTIREFNTANFRVVVDAIEDFDVDLSFDETGEVLAKLESGRYVSFCARVRVLHHEIGEIATDYIGGCIYDDFAGFQAGPYFSDMVHEACTEARARIKSLREQTAAIYARGGRQ